MAEINVPYIYRLKGGEQIAVEYQDPILDRREPVVVFCEDGSTKMKIGDGVHKYSELPFISAKSEFSREELINIIIEVINSEVGEIDEDGAYGIQKIDGKLVISGASTTDVDEKSNNKPITPSIFEYALKKYVDKTYDSDSSMPQSGKAIAQALKEYIGNKLYEAPYVNVDELPRHGEIDKIYIINDKQYIYNLKDKNASFEKAEIWDGTTQTEPKLVNGIYEITNGAELAYVIANSGGENNVYKLTKDIYLNKEFDFNTGTLNGKNLNNWFDICWNKSFAGSLTVDSAP